MSATVNFSIQDTDKTFVKLSIFFVIFFPLLQGCATGWLNVDSSPQQSEVFVKVPGSSEYKSLGPAPLNKKLSEVKAMVDNAKTLVIEVRKSGYVSRSVVITDADSSSDVRLNFELSSLEKLVKDYSRDNPDKQDHLAVDLDAQKQLLADLNQKHLVETNQIVDQLFEAQRMTQVGRLDDANRRLEELQKTYPNVSAIYEMQGGIAFMKSDFAKALDNYALALKANPTSIELLNMRSYLEKKLKIERREPAGQN